MRALDEYVAIIKGKRVIISWNKSSCLIVDEDADRRKLLRTKVKQGVIAAETLKRRMHEMNPHPPSIAPAATTGSAPSDGKNRK